MRPSTRREFIVGPAGRIECAVDQPQAARRGIALIAHPHPLFGGTLDNKVVQTLARAFVELGYETWRPNFRGVGETEGDCTVLSTTSGHNLPPNEMRLSCGAEHEHSQTEAYHLRSSRPQPHTLGRAPPASSAC